MDSVFSGFRPVTEDEVAAAVHVLSNKQCTTDPIPTWLLKECSVELTLFLCRLLNASLLSGTVPTTFNSAYICPLIKKPDMDTAEVNKKV